MPRFSKFALLPLAALLAAPAGFSQQTGTSKPPPEQSKKNKAAAPPAAPVSELVTRILEDEARLDAARRLSALAVTPDEKQLALKAVRLADHQLELAFLVALRRATDNPPPPTPQIAELDITVKKLQGDVDDQQVVVEGLKKRLARTRGRRKEAVQAQLEMEQAKLELASDELADAREDLINAGGDIKTQLERLQAEHNAAEQAASSAAPAAVAPAGPTSDTLLAHLSLWMNEHNLRNQIQAADADVSTDLDGLRQRMDAITAEVAAESKAASAPPAVPPHGGPPPSPSAAAGLTLEMLQRQSRNQKILASMKLRFRDISELVNTYQKWDALEATKQKETTRSLIFSALWIALIVLIGVISNRVLQRLFSRMTEDRRRLHTLRTLSRFGVQAFCLALILLVVLGPPSQLATLVAFAGAGLTVALKDFIVSFIGWFMLMGKHGVHAGDWVEINGVCGEVLEITVFHTVLLETGAWNDPGHPTGRKVTFTNAYAIEGHYFNFTTSGQWLWDEIEFLVPPGEHPNALADAVLQLVTKETAANTQLAEQEWSRLAPKTDSSAAESPPAVSAAPVLSVRPSGSGIVGRIRYVTRANERFQTRTRLYHLVVEALQAHATAAHQA